MQKAIRSGVVALMASLLGGISAHAETANTVNHADGAWFSGYKQGRNTIELKMTNIAGVGRLDISARGWEPLGNAICQYVFQYPSLNVAEVHLNGSSGTPDKCPAKLTFDMERTGADNLKLVFNEGTPLTEAELVAGLRPLRDEDRRVKVDGLDILDVKTGMARAEVETILKEAGYEHDESSTRVAQGQAGWTLETHYFVKNTGESDDVTVAYSESKTPKVMIVGRDWKIPPSSKVSALTLKKALLDKYGPEAASYDESRAYDRQGNNLTNSNDQSQACKAASLQQIKFVWNRKGQVYNGSINLYCGPFTEMRIGTSLQSGLASYLTVWIADPDEIWDNFWRTWSISEHEQIEALYHSVAGATGAAPKL